MIDSPVFPAAVTLETDRLYLRELTPEVYNHLFTNCSDDEITAYFHFITAEELAEEKAKFKQGYSTYYITSKVFHLMHKQTNSFIGKCGYHVWVPKHRRAEVGYELFSDEHKQKGLMTEALSAVLQHGFEQMGLYRVEALIADYNVASHRLLKHFGFKEEGTVRGHYVVDGVNEDSLMLSLLLPEYEQLKNSRTS